MCSQAHCCGEQASGLFSRDSVKPSSSAVELLSKGRLLSACQHSALTLLLSACEAGASPKHNPRACAPSLTMDLAAF